jgi:UDP-N-acetylglucosamine transferase subunit ALG13
LILVTVGTQLTFDRLVKGVENWALEEGYNDIVFQVGRNAYHPKIGVVHEFLPAKEMDGYSKKVNLIIGHAGMGTILTSLTEGKPLVIMPRLHKYSEHRNDHQMATFNNTKSFDSIFAAEDESYLSMAITSALQYSTTSKNSISNVANEDLIQYLRHTLL